MAQRVHYILEDDLDGGDATETVTFALDGVTYEIDLNDDNAAKMRDALAPYVGAGRRVGGRRSSGTGRGSNGRSSSGSSGGSGGRSDLTAVREWARDNGYQVSDRGRISAEVQEAYDKAQR